MQGLTIFLSLALLASAAAMTNREFLKTVGAVETDAVVDDDDALELPGKLDDELDLEALLAHMKQTNEAGVSDMAPANGEDDLAGGSCSCSHGHCHCCYSKGFSIKILWHRYSVNLNACVFISYIHGSAHMSISLYGHTVYSKAFALTRFRKCFDMHFVKLCVGLTNVNAARRHFCVDFSGSISVIVKTWHYHTRVGCVTIPVADEDKLDYQPEAPYVL